MQKKLGIHQKKNIFSEIDLVIVKALQLTYSNSYPETSNRKSVVTKASFEFCTVYCSLCIFFNQLMALVTPF
jgi:hypothetical protein